MRTRIATAVALTAGLALLLTAGTPDARDLTRDLGAETAEKRDTAARRLLAMGSAAEPALAETAKSGNAAARRRARALLALIEDGGENGHDARRREADAIVQAARRRDGELRPTGMHDQRLTELGDAGALAVARAAQREADVGAVRPRTGAAIGRHPSAAGMTTLASALHGDRILGSTLVRVARRLESDQANLLTDDTRERLQAVLAAPRDPRRRGAAALLATLDTKTADSFATDPDPRVRLEAVHALGRKRTADAGTLLERLAVDPDIAVRRAALGALRNIPGKPRSEPAHANADHPDAGVRAAAAELLGRDAVPESLAVLWTLSSDCSVRVRAAANRSLITLRRRLRATQ